MPETVILDPGEVADGRVALDITRIVGEAGIDWGDHQVEKFMSDGAFGSVPVSGRLPNVQVQIPLLLGALGASTFATDRRNVQAKAALFQREGGWLKRQTDEGHQYAEIVSATLRLGGDRLQALNRVDSNAVLTIERLPDWYGDEITGLDHVETVHPELVFLVGASYFDTLMGYTPALYWRLGVGGATDQSGNARNGTAAGGVTLGGAAAAITNDTDKATDFDGSDDRITSSYNPFTNASSRSFCGWANRDTNGTIDTLFGSDSATAGNWVRLHIASGGSGDVTFTVNGGTNSVTWSAAWPGTAQWVHWALTFNEATDTAELFINGASMGTKTVSQAYNGSPGNFEVGAHSGSTNPFDGKMDEFAVFQRLLHAAEIRHLRETALSDPATPGDYPSRTRIAVDEDSGRDRLGLIASIRSRHYSSSPTARMEYPAEKLTPMDLATLQTAADTFGAGIRHNNLPADWVGVASTELAGVGHLTHTGTYAVWVEAATTSAVPPELRLQWDVGDLSFPTDNRRTSIPAAGGRYLLELGEVRLDPAPRGAHRWQGVIQAKGATGGENVYLTKLYLFNCDEGYLVVRPLFQAAPGLTGDTMRDDFAQTSGNLTGKSLTSGQTWTFVAGDTDDYTINTINKTVQRTSVSDTSARIVSAGTNNYAAIAMQVDIRVSALLSGVLHTPFIRGELRAVIGDDTIQLEADPGGPTLATDPVPIKRTAGDWYTVRLLATATGVAMCWFFRKPAYASADPIVWYVPALATGGALETGRVGLGDNNQSGNACTREYDNFRVWVPDLDAVMYANQSIELTHAGNFREDAAGVGSSVIVQDVGQYLRMPPAGLENRPTEVLIRASRGDLDLIPNTGKDAISAKAAIRPSWLLAPGV